MVKLVPWRALVGLRDTWRRMLRQRRSPVELAACPPSELPRTAQNAVVSVSDLRIVAAAHPDPGELLPPATIAPEPWPSRRLPIPWPMFHRVERGTVRMHDMMARLRVDAGKLARVRRGDAYAEARARCLSCTTSEQCLRWLGDPEQAGKGPQFCPNLTLFAACSQDREAVS